MMRVIPYICFLLGAYAQVLTDTPEQVLTSTPISDQPSDMPSDMPSDTPSTSMSTPTDGFECSVCMSGFTLSNPNAVVPIPEGSGAGELTEAPCQFIDQGVQANPALFTEEVCNQLQQFYMEPCGCIEETATAAPSTAPPPATPLKCTICAEGDVMTLPDEVVSIPDDIMIASGVSFATCVLLQDALDISMTITEPRTCTLVRNFYSEPCGCLPADEVPTEAPTTETTSSSIARGVASIAGVSVLASVCFA